MATAPPAAPSFADRHLSAHGRALLEFSASGAALRVADPVLLLADEADPAADRLLGLIDRIGATARSCSAGTFRWLAPTLDRDHPGRGAAVLVAAEGVAALGFLPKD
jgi:hypothetical protein